MLRYIADDNRSLSYLVGFGSSGPPLASSPDEQVLSTLPVVTTLPGAGTSQRIGQLSTAARYGMIATLDESN